MQFEAGRPLALIILDGWGISDDPTVNAITHAQTPNYDEICANFPPVPLRAAGSNVGLPEKSAGSAEAGHVTIGAGRIVPTDLARIGKEVAAGEILENPVLKSAFEKAIEKKSTVHFVGLVSDGGVHSSQETLFALLRMAKREGVDEVYVHCILDGRDVSPRTADIYIDALEIKMLDIGIGKIASLCGRHYAMDEEQNWERTARAYTMLVHGEGERSFETDSAIRASFLRGIADEFIAPIVIEKRIDEPNAIVQDDDLVVFFNHNPDGMRQLVQSIAIPDADATKPNIDVVCLVEYDSSFDLPVAYPRLDVQNTLSELLENHSLRTYRITESSRAKHVSRYLNGNRPTVSQLGMELIFSAPNQQSLEAEPESRSFKITDGVISSIASDNSGVFLVNLPAADLSAEVGNFDKTVEAIQFVDTCVGGILEKIKEANGVAIITSSHGNCEQIQTFESGSRRATANEVPFHLIDFAEPGLKLKSEGSLEDIAPTILGVLGIEKPAEMTGQDLRIR